MMRSAMQRAHVCGVRPLITLTVVMSVVVLMRLLVLGTQRWCGRLFWCWCASVGNVADTAVDEVVTTVQSDARDTASSMHITISRLSQIFSMIN